MEKSIFNVVNNHTFNASIYYQFSGISQTLPFHTFGPAKRHDYIIHFVLNGQGIFFVDNEQFHLQAGDSFLIRPGESIFYQSDIKNPWTYAWISFNGSEAKQIIEHFSPFKNENHVFNTANQLKYLELIQKTLNWSDSSPQSELQLNQLVHELLIQVIQEYPSQKNPQNDFKGSKLARQAREYMDEYFETGINVNDVANELNVNRSYLTRVFTSNFGLLPKAWLIGVRINKASELLQMEKMSVDEISESVGFNNVSVFSRSFNKMVGESPSKYRKNRQFKRTTNLHNQQIKDLLKAAKPVRQTT
ncbi:AraC family transcriptional regulator [Weissella koreensis]|uniref:AraC family transcriptional regulator n=1 Tax=Weissella koreensis TaxID=165096 RepID=UPI003EE1E700